MSAVLAVADAVSSLVTYLASQPDPVPAEDQVRPGWIALGLMVLMCVATFLLWMNMRKQIRKIDFDDSDSDPDAGDDAAADHPTPSGNGAS